MPLHFAGRKSYLYLLLILKLYTYIPFPHDTIPTCPSDVTLKSYLCIYLHLYAFIKDCNRQEYKNNRALPRLQRLRF